MPDPVCLRVPTESLPATAVLPLSSSTIPWASFSHQEGVCSADSFWFEGLNESHRTPCEASPAHGCAEQCFQEFWFPQQRGDSGDVTDAALAGSRCCGCSQAPVTGMSLKPPRCQPAWHSSVCPAWAPQSDLMAFQLFSFLASIAVPLTSVLHSDTCEPKL